MGGALLAAQAGAPAVAGAATEPLTPVVVEVAAGSDPVAVAAEVGVNPEYVFVEVLNGFSGAFSRGQLARLRANRAVVAVEPDRIVARIEPGPAVVTGPDGAGAATAVPQPPQVVSRANRRIGLPLSPTAKLDGIDDRMPVDIAVLDGGVDPDHPDLNVRGGADCAPGPGWWDRDGHGTMVAGFAAARDNAIGVVGVAPGARIWSVRVADATGFIRNSSYLCGLEWVLEHYRTIEVANMSFSDEAPAFIGPCWRGSRPSGQVDIFHQRICQGVRRGVTFVAAAGNAAVDSAGHTPVSYDEVIAVSAVFDSDGLPGGLGPTHVSCPGEVDDHFTTFSNFGAVVDIAAPGACVTSTYPGGLYGLNSGTSFATPFVSGAAALLLAANPRLTPAQVRLELLARVEPGPIPGDPDAYPEGLLNVSTL